jgi:hypothetical protein
LHHIIYTYKYTQNIHPKAGLREEKKKERKIRNSNEIHQTCIGTRLNKTLKTVEQHRVEGEEG